MKVLVFYPEDDLNDRPEVYDISTPEKRGRAFAAIFRFLRDVEGAFASAQDKSDALKALRQKKSDLVRAMKKLGQEDRPAVLSAVNAIQNDIDDLINTNTLEEDYDSDNFKGIQELFIKANCGDSEAAEELLKIISYWCGDGSSRVFAYNGHAWTIVNVKNCL